MLSAGRFIPIPTTPPTLFDHGACDVATGRVFVAHTSANAVDVLDSHAGQHLATLAGYSEAAGVVTGGGTVVVTNRGAATVSLLAAASLAPQTTFPTGERPNGVAIAVQRSLVIVACVGTETSPPVLQRIDWRDWATATLPLPGRPRWCVVDAAEEHVYCAIREPSLVIVVRLRDFVERGRWALPSPGAHGIDLDTARGRLYVACDGGQLVGLGAQTGTVTGQWPLPAVPDATFYNPATGRIHVAIGDPGVIVSIDPASGETAACTTEVGAKTTALVSPDRLFVFLPQRGGALELVDR